MNKVAGLVLAAGASSRMGKPKQLLSAGSETLLERVLRETLISDLDEIALILGCMAQEIKASLKTGKNHPKLNIIENPRYEDGMSTSIIAGLSAVEDRYDHVMIILADMPFITSSLVNLLIKEYFTSTLSIGAIQFHGKRSHPVMFSRKFYPELRLLKGDVGARELFLKYPDQVCFVEPKDDFYNMDIDSPEDYSHYLESVSDS